MFFNDVDIGREARAFFLRLFTVGNMARSCVADDLLPHISEEESVALVRPFSGEEVCNVVFSLAGDKSPRLDGFPMSPFQKCWDIIKVDLFGVV